MKKIIGMIAIVLAVSPVFAGFRIDYNTANRMDIVDDAGNSMMYIDDAGTTGNAVVSGNLSATGTMAVGATTITGATSITGATNVIGATDISGALTQDGAFISEPGFVVNIDTATVITNIESFILVVGSNTSGGFAVTNTGIVLSTAAAYATNGQLTTLMGTSDTYTVRIADSATFATNDNTTYTLGLGDNLSMRYYTGIWYEVAKSTGN